MEANRVAKIPDAENAKSRIWDFRTAPGVRENGAPEVVRPNWVSYRYSSALPHV
jgi:hypothetical protein